MKLKKNFSIILVALFCAIVVASWIFVDRTLVEEETGGNFTNNRHQCHTATTTENITYQINDAASSTCVIVDMVNAKSADLNFMVYSTTTRPTLNFVYYTTQDLSADRDWFMVDGSFTEKVIATTTENLYGLYSFPIEDLSAEYLKVEYSARVAPSDIYLEVIRRNEIK